METVVDGVHRLPSNGIKVLVVGAGNSGMQAALECWRKGCDVEILEQAADISPIGDFYVLHPSGLSTLHKYPSMLDDYHHTVYDCSLHIYTPSGRQLVSKVPEWNQPGATHSATDVSVSFCKMRPVFARMQLDQLTRLGIPVHFGQEATSVWETLNQVEVRTESGNAFVGDVCLAADGIGSLFHRDITSDKLDAQDSGYAVARVAFPRAGVDRQSRAWGLVKDLDKRPEFRHYLAENTHLSAFLTGDYIGLALTHPSRERSEESWHNLQSPEFMLEELQKASSTWSPDVLDLIRQIPGKVVDWKLMFRDGNPQWTNDSGRILAIGDAAHAFVPTSGSGAVSAPEDAISIGECLRIAGRGDVGWATKVHNKLRFQRTSILQQNGFVNRGDMHRAALDKIEEDPKEATFFQVGLWIWGHNAEQYACDNYHACLQHLQDGTPFDNTNIPPGHVYKPWTLRSELSRIQADIPSALKENGYWGC